MRNYTTVLLLLILLQNPVTGFSQKQKMKWGSSDGTVTLVSGDPQKLLGSKSFTATLNAEKMKLGQDEEVDSVYIKRKVRELNAKKPGKGDDFLKEWESTRLVFLPCFIDGFNAKAVKTAVPPIDTIPGTNAGSAFTMLLHPDLLYYNQGTPMLFMRLDIIANKDKNDTIAEFSFLSMGTNSTSKHYPNYNPAAFYKAGDILAKLFDKYIFKFN